MRFEFEVRQSRKEFFNALRYKDLILLGGGYNAAMFIAENPDVRIKYICDNDSNKHGKTLLGTPICSFFQLESEKPESTILLITPTENEGIVKQIASLISDRYFYNALFWLDLEKEDPFAAYFFDHADELQSTVDLLDDEKSKYILTKIVEKHQYGSRDYSDIYSPFPYYLREMYECHEHENQIVVDIGAYQGDTVELFIEYLRDKLRKIYAFEPAYENRKLLLKTALRYPSYDIRVFPFAVSDKDGREDFVYVDVCPGGSFLKNRMPPYADPRGCDKCYVQTKKLDDLISPEEKITLIKMDIEGGETDALRGAEKIIKRHKPCLAIAIYHSGSDYVYIPKFIKEIVPEYKLYVRHHSKDFCETVLYAFI
jgi:FkbM family methyltransferase